jgi:hypothetical protein
MSAKYRSCLLKTLHQVMKAQCDVYNHSGFWMPWMRIKAIEDLESPFAAPICLAKAPARLFDIVEGLHKALDHHASFKLCVHENARKGLRKNGIS